MERSLREMLGAVLLIRVEAGAAHVTCLGNCWMPIAGQSYLIRYLYFHTFSGNKSHYFHLDYSQ